MSLAVEECARPGSPGDGVGDIDRRAAERPNRFDLGAGCDADGFGNTAVGGRDHAGDPGSVRAARIIGGIAVVTDEVVTGKHGAIADGRAGQCNAAAGGRDAGRRRAGRVGGWRGSVVG
ncbi:hypothetical protein SDC9_195738 [bioreactor metagenome]|uniref:Uncharacterized protein n=1 Tax=bioreactor metagenome TaxID=1076179 RepID=A0A645ILD1_9ZZZZ